MTDRKHLSERAKERLRRASLLLQSDPQAYGLARGWKLDDAGGVYEAIQAAIEGLAEPARERLRSHVDWVEEYEQAEAVAWPSEPRER